MKEKKQPTANTTHMVSISGLAVFVLGSMLWNTVSAYIHGGSDAPTLGILIAALLVLGGGIVFALWLMIRSSRLSSPPAGQEEASSDDN